MLGASGAIKSNFMMSGLLKIDQFQSTQKLGDTQYLMEPQIMTEDDLSKL